MKSKIIVAVLVVGLLAVGAVIVGRNVGDASTKTAKNVILMISDGCGANQILATDYFTTGKAGSQIYESFPVKLNVSTFSYGEIGKDDNLAGVYNPDTAWSDFDQMTQHPTDSAAAATAMSTGIKTYNTAIGVNEDLQPLRNITQSFEALGRSTGVVTSVEFSSATPAAFIAHNKKRDHYAEIANEMILESATDVIMGTGNPFYDDNGQHREMVSVEEYQYVGGRSTWDGLVAGAVGNDANGDGDIEVWQLIQTKDEFTALQFGATPERVIGVPQVYTTLQEARSGEKNPTAFGAAFLKSVPDLSVMVKGALNVLDDNQAGFFLMIEGGAVDWASADNHSGRLIEEQAAFNAAAAVVCNWVEQNSSWDETLVIVTADHETGYLSGQKGIFSNVMNNGRWKIPTMVWNSRSHTNQLVPLFAKGPGAELFRQLADEKDPKQGAYLDNTEIFRGILDLAR